MDAAKKCKTLKKKKKRTKKKVEEIEEERGRERRGTRRYLGVACYYEGG